MSRNPDQAAKAAENTAAQVSERMSSVREELSSMASGHYEGGREHGKALARSAGRDASRLMEKGSEAAGQLRSQASDLAVRTEDLVRQRPAVALGIAVGLGVLVGMLTRRR